jgi:hypothetical protein
MVRTDRLEGPTLWFEASNQRTFIDLAVGTGLFSIAHCCELSKSSELFATER